MTQASGKAIVILDDEMSFTTLLGDLLAEHFTCPILTFSNPLTLLESMPELDIGVVVTDYYMPYLNGLELIHKAAERAAVAPACILITGHTLHEDEETERPAHFKSVLPKPFHWQQLATLIERHWPDDAPLPLRYDRTR